MAAYLKEKIRNIALIGHSGEGKTSLLEAILYLTKSTDRLGKVDDGTTVSDYDPEEIARRMSINLSVANTNYKGYKFNFLDVPGFFDFEGEMVAALSVADSAIVVSGANGILTPGAEKAIDYCMENKIPTMVFINGINKENTDYFKTIEAISARYGIKVNPIEIPVMEGNKVAAYYDVIRNKAFDINKNVIDIPASVKEIAENYRNTLIELAAEATDELMEKFFSGEELTEEEVINGCKERILKTDLIPVTAGVAAINVELTGLLDNIIDIMPAPQDKEGMGYMEGENKGVLPCDENGRFAAKVFKTVVDPFVGKLLLFKVVSGKISTGDTVLNSFKDETEKVNSMYTIKGKKQEAVEELNAGDIGALSKLNYTSTNDTLCEVGSKIALDAIAFPEPVISLAVTSEEKGLEDKVISGLIKMQDEDSTFKVEKNNETNEVLMSGLGEAQLEIICRKLKNKFKVAAKFYDPKVAYRETIRKTVTQQGKHKKQSGGHGQYGDVHIRFEPCVESDFEFGVEVVGGAVPKNFYPAIEKGLRESILSGVLAGYPVVGLKAVLYDGSYHDVDSSEMAFKLAASMAYKEGLAKANPVLLEPIMSVKTTAPESYMGDVMGDFSKRRGRIMGTENVDGKTIINAEVPQSEMVKYATDLRAMTQGRGKFSMQHSRYDEVPSNIAQKVIDEYKRQQAEK